MADNPYESPTALSDAQRPDPKLSLGIFKIYRILVLVTFALTTTLCFMFGILSRTISDEGFRGLYTYLVPAYYVYAWAFFATLLSILVMPLRVLYLLVCLGFKDAAIDASLVVAAFGILYLVWKLAPITA